MRIVAHLLPRAAGPNRPKSGEQEQRINRKSLENRTWSNAWVIPSLTQNSSFQCKTSSFLMHNSSFQCKTYIIFNAQFIIFGCRHLPPGHAPRRRQPRICHLIVQNKLGHRRACTIHVIFNTELTQKSSFVLQKSSFVLQKSSFVLQNAAPAIVGAGYVAQSLPFNFQHKVHHFQYKNHQH